jgi:hypothetical protein
MISMASMLLLAITVYTPQHDREKYRKILEKYNMEKTMNK